ncbi:MAG TPA: glucuronate isomerase, partial [Spirochaetia bacterium]|nr:glucuronate isomerase [Spirochaetia bacterium]
MRGRFLDKDFLLESPVARRLYHEHAERTAIYDFHCHLPVKDIADDRQFANLTQIWLGGDHYKWRAMRTSGVPERLITGEASDLEKFKAWADVVPSTVANPLYLWTHLELARYFGIAGKVLAPATAQEIYDACSAMLARKDFSVRGLLRRMSVRVVCTTDDPADSLEHHERLAGDADFEVTVVPAFRADSMLAIDKPAAFNAWVERLSAVSGIDIRDWGTLLDALRKRHQDFHDHGCRLSDRGIEIPYADDVPESEIRSIFLGAREGRAPGPEEVRRFRSAALMELAGMDAKAGWAQQLHVGALRDVNSRFFRSRGPNSGFDTIGDAPYAASLAAFLNRLDAQDILPRTILYCLNPADNAVLASMAGNFPG